MARSASARYYATHPEAAAKKVQTQAEINRRPEEKERRARLNRERRRRGIYGKGGKDVSHTESGNTTLEDPSTNRARNGHGDNKRLRADAFRRPITAGSLRGKPCGKSFISGRDQCSKAVQRAFTAITSGAATPTPDPGAARRYQHYIEHRRDPKVSNIELVDMMRSFRGRPETIQRDIDMAATSIRRSGVELDYDVFSKIYKNDPVKRMDLMSDAYHGVHIARNRSMQAGYTTSQSFIYVRPTRPPGTKLVFDTDGSQHQVRKMMKEAELSVYTSIDRPDFFSSSLPIDGGRTTTDESITLIHELGHAVHRRSGYSTPIAVPVRKGARPFVPWGENTRGIQVSPDGKMRVAVNSAVFRADANRVLSWYGLSDFDKGKRETFAEGFTLYIMNGEALRSTSPLFYSWVDDIVRRAYLIV